MKILIFSLYNALACAQTCSRDFNNFVPEEPGYDVVTSSNLIIKIRVANENACYNLCRSYGNQCNGFTFSDRPNHRNCWIKQFDTGYIYYVTKQNEQRYKNVCFYKTSNVKVGNGRNNQNQYGYKCAGHANCLSHQNQINGNMLCSSTFLSHEEADYYCSLFQCDGIVTNRQSTDVNNHRYEAVNKVAIQDSCQFTSNAFEFIPNRQKRRQKRSEPTIIQTKQTIQGHDVKPFTQIKTHFTEANVTVYNVDPHKNFDRNFAFVFHNAGKVVGVTPESCMLVFQDVPLQNYTEEHDSVITAANYKTVDERIQFVKSNDLIFRNPFLLSFCSGKKLLKEEYLVSNSIVSDNDDTIKITEKDMITRNIESTRSKRSKKTCKLSNCRSGDVMLTVCSQKDCTGGGWCYFKDMGVIKGRYGEIKEYDHREYDHIRIQNYWCLPCCLEESNYWRMPVCTKVSYVHELCPWYNNKGRCGEEFD